MLYTAISRSMAGLVVVIEMAISQYILRPPGYSAWKINRRDSCDIALRVTYLSLQMLDLGLTLLAAHLGFPELNPIIKATLNSTYHLAILKFGIPLLIILFVPGKLLIPAIVLIAAVVGWNIKELLLL